MKDFEFYLKETAEVGYIKSIISSLFYVSGLPTARLNELILTENGLVGIVKSIHPELVEVMVFEGQGLTHNMKVVRTNELFQVPVTESYLGRVVDPFGVPQDSLIPIAGDKIYVQTDPKAPAVNERVRIWRPLETGVMAVDMQVPIGLGQRELILGDQKTGKTIFALQAMVNAARNGLVGVYVSIGKKKSDLKFVEEFLSDADVLNKVVIVAATSSDPAPLVYLSPFSGLSIAEFFRDLGRDVLVVLDDLTTHAKFYREISLLSRRPPGRQSYPGDIFHVHARLAERSGNIKRKTGKVLDKAQPKGEVSITLLPIAETIEGDMAGFIQTNLMAMTDGHVFFDVAESKRGRHPSVSFPLSVSRVGYQTRTPLERDISASITLGLSEYRKAEEIGRFGVELTAQTLSTLHAYERLEELLNQDYEEIIPRELQIILLGLFFAHAFEGIGVKEVRGEKLRIADEFEAGKYNNFRLEIGKCRSLVELTELMMKNLSLFAVGSARKTEKSSQANSEQVQQGKRPGLTVS